MVIDLSDYGKPNPLSPNELEDKLFHLSSILRSKEADGIIFRQEGALRWLTGVRHQIINIAPDAVSPVQVLVVMKEDGWDFTFVTSRFEMPRIKEQLPPIYEDCPKIQINFSESFPPIPNNIISSIDSTYFTVVSEIIQPLVGGLKGNQYKKLQWLSCMTSAIMAETANTIEPGMNGSIVRGMLFNNFSHWDIESNLIMVSLSGQEKFFHPLYDSRYRIDPDSWVKLVAGTRYVDMIVSASIMIKFNGCSEHAQRTYRCLQEAVIEYADCYRVNALESDIYTSVGERFRAVGERFGLPEFFQSAYAHHLGGPTSPLGNRDYIITQTGSHKMFSWMQFALNPMETKYYTKIEVQGIIMPFGPPLIIDSSTFTPPLALEYTKVVSSGGTNGNLANIVLR